MPFLTPPSKLKTAMNFSASTIDYNITSKANFFRGRFTGAIIKVGEWAELGRVSVCTTPYDVHIIVLFNGSTDMLGREKVRCNLQRFETIMV